MARKRAPSGSPPGSYDVGYGRPPKHTRFKPGQSGNPRGRPKGSADMSTHIEDALKEKVVISESGRRRTITKGKAIAKQVVNKAASGNLQAARLLLLQQKAQQSDAQQVRAHKDIEAKAPQPEPSPIDLSKCSTAEMEKISEVALILEGHSKARPSPLMPPGDAENVRPEDK